MNWDEYYLEIAEVVRQKSKDPNTKIGAVLVGPEHQIISTGFNGFPRGIDETIASRWARPEKYLRTEHAERNTLYNAARHGIETRGSTLYLLGMGPPSAPCADCARGVIQCGIVEVVGKSYKAATAQYAESIEFAVYLLREAGVTFREVA